MEKPEIRSENIVSLFETKFIKVFDLQYAPGKHYYDATRRTKENLVAVKKREEFRNMLPDAVSCWVILNIEGEEPKLCMTKEFRYPAGQFLLSVPAGLVDPADKDGAEPLLATAKRELKEETGLLFDPMTDRIEVLNPFLFSTPGMTDESNGIVLIVINRKKLPGMSQAGAVGSECFDGFTLLTKDEARKLWKQGTDEQGIYYSVYTWMALTYFIADLWKE